MKSFVRFLLRHRRLMLFLFACSLGGAAYLSRTIDVRFQYRDFYAYPGNPQLPKYEEFHRVFGDPAGYVVVMLNAPDVFAPPVLEYVKRLTVALEPEREFRRIRSLARVNALRGTPDGVVSGAVMTEVPIKPADVESLRRSVLGNPLLVRRLVSKDSTSTAVLAEMKHPAEYATISQQRTAIEVVERVLKANPPPSGVSAVITGAPTVEVATTTSLLSDQILLMPGVMLVLTLALFLTFRSWHGVALPLISVMLAVAWTAAAFALMGRPVDIVGSIIPTTLLVYGVVDPIFMITRFLSKRAAGFARDEAIVEAAGELALPCFLTSVTTAVGFAVFMTAKLPTVFYYGLTVAIGVLLVWVSTVVVLPVLLAVFPEPREQSSGLRSTQWVASFIERLWRKVSPRRLAVVVGSVLVLLAGGWLARVQHISNEYVGSLPRGETYQTVRLLEQKLGGVLRTVVYLEGTPDSMKRPDVLRAIERVDAFIEQRPLVTNSISLADLVAEANQAFNEGNPAHHRVPTSETLIAQYLALTDPVDRADFVTDDYARSAITALSIDAGSEIMRQMRRELQAEVDAAFAGLGVEATLTGNAIVGWSAMDQIVVEVLWGFVAAFLAAAFIVWIPFRSLKTAVSIVLPNLLPVMACFLVFRFGGLKLRLDNAVVLCIAIGGLFNTTIHLISQTRLRAERPGANPDEAIAGAVRDVAPPAFFTAAILSAGFSVLLLSSFPGLQALGFLSMVTVFIAFVADMFVTPAILRQWVEWSPRGQPDRPASDRRPGIPEPVTALVLDRRGEGGWVAPKER